MSLNLWKIGGQPTSYNPLPTFGVGLPIKVSDYVLTFKAKSATNASIRVYTGGNSNFNTTYALTSEYTVIKAYVNSTIEQTLYTDDVPNVGNIIIDSIELVQKPLPKLTINGIDGFNSGKWTLHANATVVDDETIVLNATGAFQSSFLSIPILEGQTLTISGDVLQANSYLSLRYKNASDAFIGIESKVDNATKSISQLAPSGATKAYITITNVVVGTFTFTKPVLNLGSIPAPYSKKTGDKMVMPTPKKNLISLDLSQWEQGALASSGLNTATLLNQRLRMINEYPIKQNTNYIVNIGNGYGVTINFYDANGIGTNQNAWVTTPYVFNTGSNAYIKLVVRNVDDSIISLNEITNKQLMLSEGTVATPYTPYDVQVNKKPTFRKDADYLTLDGSLDWIPYGGYSHAVGVRLNGDAPLLRDKTVSPISLLKDDGTAISGGGTSTQVDVYSSTNWGTATGLIITISNAAFTGYTNDSAGIKKFFTDHPYQLLYKLKDRQMVDLPSSAVFPSSFKDYQPNLKKANTGLSFNGTSDYLQLPSMTMDSIEIECLIDSVQGTNTYLLDARTGLVNGYIYSGGASVGSAWSELNINDVPIAKDWVNIPKGSRIKILAKSSTFTDDITIFRSYAGTGNLKGTLYKVTCYLANQIVAQYDFENPKNVVGTTVLQNAVNLIPSFEDSRWTINANAKVLGKDVLHLDATAINQYTTFKITTLFGNKYFFNSNGGLYYISGMDSTDTWKEDFMLDLTTKTFTISNANTTQIWIRTRNSTTGSFDFIRPQLYQLDGKEGTITGVPIPLRKPSKRSLYSKR